MTKLEQAARQALEALVEAKVVAERYQNAEKREQAITALREALGYCIDEGCPHKGTTHTCVNPLAEQAEQEPLLWGDDKFAPHERPQKQEPVAIAIVTKTKTDANYITNIDLSITKTDANYITNIDLSIAEAGYKLPSGEHSLYAAPQPVQQVDLSDDEIDGVILECALMGKPKFARAVIAAYKEKNK